jgi:hypothetical protein
MELKVRGIPHMKRLFQPVTFASVLLLTSMSFGAGTPQPEKFTGRWVGKGTYILNGVLTQCSLIEMEFKGTATSFEFTSGRRICDQHTETFYKVQMQVANGELLFNSQKVGEVSAQVISSAFSVPEGDGRIRHWRMSMRRNGNNLMYEENRIMDDNETPMISFAGMLTRVPDDKE